MQRSVPSLAALRAFEAVGRLGGIRRAADALGVNHAVISRQIKGLEQHLGRTLYDRATNQLTPAAARYHARISGALDELAVSTLELSAEPSELRIWCSPGIATPWLTARLPDFAPRPGLVIDFRTSDCPPDFLQDEADGDIRYQADHQPVQNAMRGRTLELARPPVFPVGAPNLVTRLSSRIQLASDLLDMPLIEEADTADWHMWFAAQGIGGMEGSHVARYGNAHLALAAARAGQGIALGNHYLVAEDLRNSLLAPITSFANAFHVVELGSYVFRADPNRWDAPNLRKFRRWLQRQFVKDPPLDIKI